MPSIRRIAARTAAVATVVGAAAALSISPAAAVGGYWSGSCDPGRACIVPAADHSVFWVFDSCGYQPMHSFWVAAQAHGNPFKVTYADGRWDRVEPWSSRGLDPNNEVKRVDVLC